MKRCRSCEFASHAFDVGFASRRAKVLDARLSEWQRFSDGALMAQRLADKFYGFFQRNGDRNVDKSALDLRPRISRFSAEAFGILFEGLVQDSEKDQPAVTSGRELRDILQQMYVTFTVGGGFKASPEFIKNKEEAAVFCSALDFTENSG